MNHVCRNWFYHIRQIQKKFTKNKSKFREKDWTEARKKVAKLSKPRAIFSSNSASDFIPQAQDTLTDAEYEEFSNLKLPSPEFGINEYLEVVELSKDS